MPFVQPREYIDAQGVLRRARIHLRSGKHICLVGPPGTGKTVLAEQLAGGPQNLTTILAGRDLLVSELVGGFQLRDGSAVWWDGPLLDAVKQNKFAYLDEITSLNSECWDVLQSLLDHRRMLEARGLGETYTADPAWRFLASFNPDDDPHGASDRMPRKLRDRFVFLEIKPLPGDIEQKLLQDTAGIDAAAAARLVAFAALTRRGGYPGGGISTRMLESAAEAICAGLTPDEAIHDCMVLPLLSHDPTQQEALYKAAVAAGLTESQWLDDLELPTFEDLAGGILAGPG